MNERTKNLVDSVVEGGSLAPEDALYLCTETKSYSPESYYLQWGSHELIQRASGGRALLYSQIGIDANPCPGNCWYCSFAAKNNDWKDKAEVPLDQIVEYSRILDDAGVHMISLMTTANYDFQQYLDVISAVRETIKPNVGIMVNTGDFDYDQAVKLKEAGGDIVYHAVRVGEGKITSIPLEKRWDTVHAAIDAGLRISSGIEPMYHGADIEEAVQRMYQIAELDPICSGIGELVCVEGTPMENYENITKEERRILDSVWHLVAGLGKQPYGGMNTRWIDAGANPRGTEMLVGEERIRSDVERARAELVANEWTVPSQDTPFWKLY